jgi:hypothetical protein
MYVRCLCNVLMNNIYFKFRFTNPCHSRSAVGNFPCEFAIINKNLLEGVGKRSGPRTKHTLTYQQYRRWLRTPNT